MKWGDGLLFIAMGALACLLSSCHTSHRAVASSAIIPYDSPAAESFITIEESELPGTEDASDPSGHGLCYPDVGESYVKYQQRVDATLVLQEEQLSALQLAVRAISDDLATLEDELSLMLAQQVDLRLGLAAGYFAGNLEIKGSPPFELYTVQQGDTLRSIAYKKYGCYEGWFALYQINSERLSLGPDHVEEGDSLILPNFATEHLRSFYQR